MNIHFENLSYKNLEFVRQLRNQNRAWFMYSEEVNEAGHGNWFRRTVQSGDVNLIIVDSNTRIQVGFISIYNITPDGHATIGRMMVDDSYKRKGYMLRALVKVLVLASEYYHIHEITLEVKKSNIPARDLYTRFGFVTIGFTNETLIMRKRFL